jgi:hypothetical protein
LVAVLELVSVPEPGLDLELAPESESELASVWASDSEPESG